MTKHNRRCSNTQSEKEDNSGDQTDKSKLPIDRGWAWIIVLATFCINLLHIGMYRSYGILFVEFLKEFNASKSVTSLIGGIYSATYSLTALFVLNVLIDKFSIRVLCVLGGMMMSAGGILSYFAMNLEFLIFAQSILAGAGSAFLYGPSIVITGQYFEKRQALAQAISSCGVSLGGMVVPQLIRYLLTEYGLRGTLLISGGLFSEILIFALLYRPAPERKFEKTEQTDAIEGFKKHTVSQTEFEIVPIEYRDDSVSLTNGNHNGHTCINGMVNDHLDEEMASNHERTNMSAARLSLHRREPFRTRTESDPMIISKNPGIFQSLSVPNDSFLSSDSLNDTQDANSNANIKEERTPFKTLHTNDNSHSHTSNHKRKATSDSYLGSFMDTVSQSSYLKYASNADIHVMSTLSLNKSSKYAEEETKYSEKHSCCRKVIKSFDFSVFRMPHFYLILVQDMFAACAVDLFSSFLPASAKEAGLTDVQAALLITIYAGVDCISRFMSGVIVETGKIRPHHLLASCLMIIGVLYQLTRFYTSMNLMIMYAVLFGTFSGALPSMNPVVTIEFLGMDNFPKALGFLQVFHGVFVAGITPLIGALRDITGTYEASYHLLGALGILAGLFLFMEPLARRIRDSTKVKFNTEEVKALKDVKVVTDGK